MFAASSPLVTEYTTNSRPVLLATRARFPEKVETLTDARNDKFLLKKEEHITLLLPETPLKVDLPAGVTREFRDMRYITGKEDECATFNFDHLLA